MSECSKAGNVDQVENEEPELSSEIENPTDTKEETTHDVSEEMLDEGTTQSDTLPRLVIPSFVAHNSRFGISDFVVKLCMEEKHKWLCAIPIEFIINGANTRGFHSHPMFEEAMLVLKGDLVITRISKSQEPIVKAARGLYYLIHARYILTDQGLAYILKKYHNHEFGCCPRYFCYNQPVIPFGFSPDLERDTIQIFCGKCSEIYSPSNTVNHIDGAAFGPLLPEMFYLQFPHLRPQLSTKKFQPKLYGFKIHSSCYQQETDTDDEDSDDAEKFKIQQFSKRVQ
ncbi:casein kinase II subunit beta'-like [Onthophagus taurus]|uniref:casein kinase II subunit beta'-like n=1 Tax=Onthophagus taurus TaxID=166361 RepID=UPI000C203C76|nr:casein kinase II subunit beta'-like [Onthophagus taurus]